MNLLVSDIFGLSDLTKIGGCIVAWVSIQMGGNQTRRFTFYESQCNKAMNAHAFSSVVRAAKQDSLITILVYAGLKRASTLRGILIRWRVHAMAGGACHFLGIRHSR
jgi:hypothetical protein